MFSSSSSFKIPILWHKLPSFLSFFHHLFADLFSSTRKDVVAAQAHASMGVSSTYHSPRSRRVNIRDTTLSSFFWTYQRQGSSEEMNSNFVFFTSFPYRCRLPPFPTSRLGSKTCAPTDLWFLPLRASHASRLIPSTWTRT